MKTIEITGYLDDEVFWGDEVTPEMLKDALTGADGDVTVRIHSYGGSCAAATRMYDMLKEHPGNVLVVISGVAASAASVLVMAGDRVEMTPGSIFMMHNPACIAWGEERDFEEAIHLLRATKDSIINIYDRRTSLGKDALAQMMDATTWLDAEGALERGFIDGITGDAVEGIPQEGADAIRDTASAGLKAVASIDRREAEVKVRAWVERQKPHARMANRTPEPNIDPAPATPAGVSHEQLTKRLLLLRH